MVLSPIFLQLGWFKMYQVERAPTRWQQSLDLILFKILAQETQTGAWYQSRGVGWRGRWEGGSKVRGHMYTDG